MRLYLQTNTLRWALRCSALLLLVAGCGDKGGVTEPPPAVTPPVTPVTPPPVSDGSVEGRALWVNRFEYDSPAKIQEIIGRAADANFNIVYFQVRGQGDAYYRSTLEPCAVALCGSLGGATMRYDPLQTAVETAAARGIELHAWVNALSGFSSPTSNNASFCALLRESAPGNPRHMLLAHPEWAMTNREGVRQSCQNSTAVEYVYVSPGNPGVRTHLARVSAEIVRSYPGVKGIHLDRIRYPGTAWSYDSVSLARFGRNPAADPDGWDRFRREQVNLTVREVNDSIKAVRRELVLSAAVWAIHDRTRFGWPSSSGIGDFFQDARAWAQGGYLDVAAPMTYFSINDVPCSYTPRPGGTTPNPDWACMLQDHIDGVQKAAGRQVYIGIAANLASNAALGTAEIERQVRLGRERGVKGFAVYSYNSAVAANLFPALASGVFRNKATVPAPGSR